MPAVFVFVDTAVTTLAFGSSLKLVPAFFNLFAFPFPYSIFQIMNLQAFLYFFLSQT